MRRAWRTLLRRKVSIVGLVLVLAWLFCAAFAPLISPHSPYEQHLEQKLMPPVWQAGGLATHPLGTDHLGRDMLARIVYGARISLLIGATAVVVGGGLGSLLGLLGGYLGGWWDELMMGLADVQLAFPFILLALAVLAVLGPGLGRTIAVLAIAGWVIYARLVRSEVLALREREFVQAAVASGARASRVIGRHLLPNTLPTLLVVATLEVPRIIILESSLTFLGLGVPAPAVTWGAMLADSRTYLTTHWWMAALPGLALQLTVLGLNLVGDWLRDTFDPRLKV